MTDDPNEPTALALAEAFACSLSPELIRAGLRGGYAIAADLGLDLN
ncbi:hypothetical protein [Nocardia sp. NPDC052566]